MSRDELIDMLALLVEEEKITLDEAASILRAFDAGTIGPSDLPLPAAESLPLVTEAMAAEAFRRLAARPAVQRAARVVLDRMTITFPTERGKVTATAEIIADFDAARAQYAARRLYRKAQARTEAGVEVAEYVQGANVADWHRAELRRLRDHILEQATLGKGSALTADELSRLDDVIRDQAAYLRGFAEEIAARAAAGRPMTEKAIAARLRQYDGAAYGQFWRFMEAQQDADTVVYYEARDDGATCDRCHAAETAGPYLVGSPHPVPGEVCRGRGHCRCTLRYETDPAAAARLRTA